MQSLSSEHQLLRQSTTCKKAHISVDTAQIRTMCCIVFVFFQTWHSSHYWPIFMYLRIYLHVSIHPFNTLYDMIHIRVFPSDPGTLVDMSSLFAHCDHITHRIPPSLLGLEAKNIFSCDNTLVAHKISPPSVQPLHLHPSNERTNRSFS